VTSISERQIHLWLAFGDDINDRALLDSYRAVMNDDERARELRLRFEKDRKSFIITRALVRTVLSRYAAVEPAAWQFGTNAYGRPEILNTIALNAGLNFNVAHTHGMIVLAVGVHRALGVDAEHMTQRRVSRAIADRYFATEEVAALASVPRNRQRNRFFEYWTLKESYIKARGMGLSIPLDQFSFHFPRDRAVEIRIDARLGDDPKRWQFWQFRPTADHVVAVCVERRAVTPADLSVSRIVPNQTEQALQPEFLRS
jgi:4'-phosphopantetheinyl transferase